MTEVARPTIELRWLVVGSVGLVSLLSMPVTAILFLFGGFLILIAAALHGAMQQSTVAATRSLSIGASVSVGLLVGPVLYLVLALLT